MSEEFDDCTDANDVVMDDAPEFTDSECPDDFPEQESNDEFEEESMPDDIEDDPGGDFTRKIPTISANANMNIASKSRNKTTIRPMTPVMDMEATTWILTTHTHLIPNLISAKPTTDTSTNKPKQQRQQMNALAANSTN